MTTKPARFWRTLGELERDTAHARATGTRPAPAPEPTDPVARRTFLKLMGASWALAGMSGCTRQPAEPILPWVRQPESVIPGRPLFYATAMSVGGAATGMLVESHEGRPIKAEGNPLHPASLGATDPFMQAALLELYDPDRAQTLTYLGEIRPWSSFLGAIRRELETRRTGDSRIRILTESVDSPTLASQIDALIGRFPGTVWHQWDPLNRHAARAGIQQAFGTRLDPVYRFDRAEVVVMLDADPLGAGPGRLRYTRDFAARRRPDAEGSRIYAIESMPTLSGARADHRLPVRAREVEAIARQLASAVGLATGTPEPSAGEARGSWIQTLRDELDGHRGTSLVVAGDTQPPVVHALAHAMNAALGNTDRTVAYIDPVEARPIDHHESLRALTDAMQSGDVDLLVILGGNPVYTAPADLAFAEAMDRVALRVHLGASANETSARCHWHVPQAHFLETWSDARAYDGTVSIVQPLIAPLYGGRSSHELLAAFSDAPERPGYDLVREFWRGARPGDDFDTLWRATVHDGVMAGTTRAPRPVSLADQSLPPQTDPSRDGLEIAFRPDPTVADGRFANNGWLQELPKPLTALSWDNAIIASPALLARLGVVAMPALVGGEHGGVDCPVVELRYRGRTVRGPLFPLAGHPDEAVTVHLGYGRTRAGRVGSNLGFSAARLQTSAAPWFDAGAEMAVTGERYVLACTQYHHDMEGRDLVRVSTRATAAPAPADTAAPTEPHPLPSLYPPLAGDGHQWGMAIDLNACIGCQACVVACQAENNIPVVGRAQVLRGREMHWLRVDTYHEGPAASPHTYFQPVPCMHCENAPCEVVCPVGATVHSDEGLNEMIYNRCVGTRYCSNNCPYKVRRFNFLLYQDWETPVLKLGRNPDVTVRSRGVMEKCTYCVQRINAARIDAKKENRPVRDGEIRTACEAVCPAQAIVFGDVSDPDSRVSQLKADARTYALLEELNTRPRTTYLSVLRNPHPALETPDREGE